MEEGLVAPLGLPQLVQAAEEILVLCLQLASLGFGQVELLGDERRLGPDQGWYWDNPQKAPLMVHQGDVLVEGLAAAGQGLLEQVEQGDRGTGDHPLRQKVLLDRMAAVEGEPEPGAEQKAQLPPREEPGIGVPVHHGCELMGMLLEPRRDLLDGLAYLHTFLVLH